jgi:hypothetical protein
VVLAGCSGSAREQRRHLLLMTVRNLDHLAAAGRTTDQQHVPVTDAERRGQSSQRRRGRPSVDGARSDLDHQRTVVGSTDDSAARAGPDPDRYSHLVRLPGPFASTAPRGSFPAVRGSPGRGRRSFITLGIFVLSIGGSLPAGAYENGDFSPACPTTPILIRAVVDDPRHWDGAGQGRYRRRCTTGRMPGADPRERSPPAELAPGGRSGRAHPATDRRVAVRPAQRIRPRLHPLFVIGSAWSRGSFITAPNVHDSPRAPTP